MKILHTTDLHFNKKWFNWIEKQLNNYDILCITGDFLESSKDEPLLEQIKWITSWMKNLKTPLFVCSGNHDIEEIDNENWLNNISNIYSDGSIKTIGDIKFGCIPYIAPDFFEFDRCDILLYHIPPSNSKTAIHKKNNEDWGDVELYRLLKNNLLTPKYLLCGHVHNPIKNIDTINDTIIYNPAVNKKSSIPNFNIIEV